MFKTWKRSHTWAVALVAAATTIGATAEAAEIKREPFQKLFFAACGAGNAACGGRVLTVPLNRRFEVRSVSCLFLVKSPGAVNSVILGVDPSDPAKEMYDFFVPTQLRDDGTDRHLAFNTQTLLIARAGDKLLMGVNATEDVSNINCKVAGEMVFLK